MISNDSIDTVIIGTFSLHEHVINTVILVHITVITWNNDVINLS